MQYTIRAVPAKLDKVLRGRARKTGKSLNQVLIESLARGSGVNIADQKFHDLDWFVGSLQANPGFDEAIDWLNRLPKDMD